MLTLQASKVAVNGLGFNPDDETTPQLTAVAAAQDGSRAVYALVGHTLVVGDSKGGAFLAVCGGASTPGFTDTPQCTPSTPAFHTPTVVAWGGAGVLYIGDVGNHAVRVVTFSPPSSSNTMSSLRQLLLQPPSTTYALTTLTGFKPAGGVEGAGFLDGPCTTALFQTPTGIAVVPPSTPPLTSPLTQGTTVAAFRALAAAPLTPPTPASTTQLLVSDGDNGAVRLVTFAGLPTAPTTCTVASYAGNTAGQPGGQPSNLGQGGASLVNGPLLTARFKRPAGVGVRGTLAYILDQGNCGLRVIDTATGTVGTLLDVGKGVGAAACEDPTNTLNPPPPFAPLTYPFANPQALAVTPSGAVVLADATYHWVAAAAVLWPLRGIAGQGLSPGARDGAGTRAQFNGPAGVACDEEGSLLVADRGNGVVRYLPFVVPTATATASKTATKSGTSSASPSRSPGRTSSAVATKTATATSTFSAKVKPQVAKFMSPTGIFVDKDGVVFVADSSNHRIRKITPVGVVSTLAGSSSGFSDGAGTAAKFNYPYGVSVDKDGVVFVADALNHRIRKITPVGVVSTLAGSVLGYSDGPGTAAKFFSPTGVSVDKDGVVFVAENNNHRIRKITPMGVVSTLAGSSYGFSDGTGTAAKFNTPPGVSVDKDGVVFVADRGNNRIRKITPVGVVSTLAGSNWGSNDGGPAV